LIDETILEKSINAIPRITQPKNLNPKENLSDLEHQAMQNVLTSYNKNGPKNLQAWLTESWWLTALPQQLNRFRESAPETKLFLVWKEGKLEFCEKTESGEFINREPFLDIKKLPKISEELSKKLWLERNYKELLEKYADEDGGNLNKKDLMNKKSKKYGEINIAEKGKYFYSDQLGLWK
jgi:CRISPR-associated endonuclease/helicase Cas3